MGQVIEGKSGHPVESDEEGRLSTKASTHTEDHKAALDSDTYVLPLDAIATNGAEHIAVIKNTNDKNLIVSSFTIFVATFKDTTRVKVYLNETFVYAAGGTLVVPVNMRSGVAGGADGEFYTIAAAGTDITTFGGTAVIGGIYVFERYPIKIVKRSGWIVPKNQVFSLYNIGNDNTFHGSISFYYHD